MFQVGRHSYIKETITHQENTAYTHTHFGTHNCKTVIAEEASGCANLLSAT